MSCTDAALPAVIPYRGRSSEVGIVPYPLFPRREVIRNQTVAFVATPLLSDRFRARRVMLLAPLSHAQAEMGCSLLA